MCVREGEGWVADACLLLLIIIYVHVCEKMYRAYSTDVYPDDNYTYLMGL